MQVTVVDHPLAAQLLTRLRDERTDRAGFRRAMDDLSGILVYEASRDIEAEPKAVTTPMGPTMGVEIARPPLVVPVLRAGLGMLGGVLRHLPETDTGFIGVARNEETFVPEPYMNSVPDELHGRPVLVLDPMLATGGSATAAIEVLKDWGATRIKLVNLIASPEGVAAVSTAHPDVAIYCASVDRQLNEKGYILPGLGDAGDRQFGTGRP